MKGTTARRARFAIGAALWCILPTTAMAHAPLPRRAVFSTDGTAAAISLPGFGIVLRPDARREFSYLCDALLDIPPADVPPAMAFTEGGVLLVGSASGLRSVGADGCPRNGSGGVLADAQIAALAVHPSSPNLVYAVTQHLTTDLSRSDDGGQTWEMRASWPELDPVAALVLGDTDTSSVFVSQAAPVNRSIVRVSADGGLTFSTFAEDEPRVLLAVQDPTVPSGPSRFWASARSPASVGNRGYELLHADTPAGPWTSVLEVNFFGGFAIEPSGAIWMGDEGGGVYRSLDGAATFTNVSPSTAVACLASAQGAVWGCTPGTPEQRALAQWNDAAGAFDDVVTLSNVTHMVECDPTLEVEKTCAAAWVEWQRDVLMLPPSKSAPAAAGAAPATESDSSCSFSARTGRRAPPNGATLVVLAVVLRRQRRGKSATGVVGSRYFWSLRWRYSFAFPRQSMPGSLPLNVTLAEVRRRLPDIVTTI